MKQYQVNEIFFSLQGEGMRAGTPNFFVRFSGCNLTCSKDVEGFDCDTEFVSGRKMSYFDISSEMLKLSTKCSAVILTGGEPALQINEELLDQFHNDKFFVAIETNGTTELPKSLDWICVSPKTAEHTLKVKNANEIKYVRHYGQGIPKPFISAQHKLISPAFEADGNVSRETLEWCINLVKENPEWRLSCQQHKWWGVR
jgi:7-carboxy-7-deazaguanine synthase